MDRFRIAAAVAALALLAACNDSNSVGPDADAARGRLGHEGYPTRGELRTGYILGRDGRPLKVTFEIQRGLAVFQGDILLGSAESIAASPSGAHRPGGPRFGVVADGYVGTGTARWPNGVVPYVIDPSLPSPQRVYDAMADIQATTVGIRFVARTNETDYIRIVPSTGCSSFAGRIGGAQVVELAAGCGRPEATHELSHALGMWHEQSRCDRDDYVEILWNNIAPENRHNFDKHCDGASDVAQYNEGSLMHYGAYDLSTNGQPTMVSKRGLVLGQRNGLSSIDVFTLKAMYPPATAIHRLYNPSWYGGDHLYGVNSSEGTSFGYTLESRNYFYLTSASGTSYATLYRCNVNGHHFLTRAGNCEGGGSPEASLGQVATTQVSGSIPLYRLRRSANGDRLSTTNAGERQSALNSGWTDEGITGYVWAHIPVHRSFSETWSGGDHLYGLDPLEGRSAGYILESQNFFYLTSTTGSDYATLYRCNVNGHHYVSRDANCEAGVAAEAKLGQVATWQVAGTVPLFRLRSPFNQDRLSTTNSGERQSLLSGNWIDEGTTGYVWDQP